jgi:hypothetical protein
MKTSPSRLQDIRRERVEAVIEGRIGALFSRIPALCGFSVAHDLLPVEVAVHGWPGYVAGEDLYAEIVATLAELAEERSDIAEQLRGRTFARRLL